MKTRPAHHHSQTLDTYDTAQNQTLWVSCREHHLVVKSPFMIQWPMPKCWMVLTAAIVHLLPLKDVRTNFNDYAERVFMPYIRRRLQNVKRLDVVWDRYLDNSLNQGMRNK